MPFDGFGNFLRLYSWVVDATNSVKIRADRHDDEDNNFMAGLSQCITKDGQTAVTQNIPLNSRRLVSVADPIDPQDAATKHYADTKMPLDGSVPITGDVIVKNADPSITLDGTAGSKNSIIGQKADKNRWEIVLGNATAESTGDAGSNFQLINYHDDGTLIGDVLFGTRSTGLLTVKADPTAALGIATKQYADSKVTTVTANYLPLTGGTISGNLTVTGYISTASKVVFLGTANGSEYIISQGSGTYYLGNGGTIWHSGNFIGTAGGRLAMVADFDIQSVAAGNPCHEPYSGGIITGWSWGMSGGTTPIITFMRIRYLQLSTTSGYVTIGYYG